MSAERRNVPAIVEAATPTLRSSLAVAGGAGDRGCCGRQPVVCHHLGLWGHCAVDKSVDLVISHNQSLHASLPS